MKAAILAAMMFTLACASEVVMPEPVVMPTQEPQNEQCVFRNVRVVDMNHFRCMCVLGHDYQSLVTHKEVAQRLLEQPALTERISRMTHSQFAEAVNRTMMLCEIPIEFN